MNIRYETSRPIDADEFVDLLRRSTLAERRPVDDLKCIQAMLQHFEPALHRVGRGKTGWRGAFAHRF